LEDASDPTPTRANLKERRKKGYTTVFPFPGYADASRKRLMTVSKILQN